VKGPELANIRPIFIAASRVLDGANLARGGKGLEMDSICDRRCFHQVATLCGISHMATNLDVDQRLLNEALKAGGHRTKKETVNEALKEYAAIASSWV
jgi:hypothetical protein